LAAGADRLGTSPPSVLSTAVQRACGAGTEPATVERLLQGESNEVYDVALDDGRRVVVRIGRRTPSLFPGEQWAIDAARAAGAPVPDVPLVDTIEDLAVCVETHAGGAPLIQVAASMDADTRQTAVVGAGQALRQIHAVGVDGFGFPLSADGRGPDGDDGAAFLAMPARSPEWYRPAAEEAGFDLERFDRALGLLEAGAARFADEPPCLVHADFGAKHVLVHPADGRVTAIIDFETARGGDGAYDVAAWDIYFREWLRTSWLLDGYGEVGGDFDERVRLHRLLMAMRLLSHSAGPQGFKGFVPLALTAIDEALSG
jgi:aminoglycoside phosphotransferase (APT) family kinase protein